MNIHFILMAAGNSRRFGSNKLLFELDGKALYQHGLDTLLELMGKHPDYTLTVVSQYEEILQGAAARIEAMAEAGAVNRTGDWKRRMAAVYSPLSQQGASYTIKAGICSLLERYGKEGQPDPEDRFVFMVADQPYLKAETLERLAETGTLLLGAGVSLRYGDKVGNPCLFPAEWLPELLALEGEQGGRKVLKRCPCVFVEADSEMELWDLDCEEDLRSKL